SAGSWVSLSPEPPEDSRGQRGCRVCAAVERDTAAANLGADVDARADLFQPAPLAGEEHDLRAAADVIRAAGLRERRTLVKLAQVSGAGRHERQQTRAERGDWQMHHAGSFE